MWERYFNDRLIDRSNKGFLVIKPTTHIDCIPLWCSVCEALYTSSDDAMAHEKFDCCALCADKWAYSRASEWHDGWRPSQVEIDDDRTRRTILYRTKILTYT